jgi:hypothetical protein
MRRATGLSSLARSFFAESSNSINQAKLALHFFQGVRLAMTRSQFRKTSLGHDEIFDILTFSAVVLACLNQRPGYFVWQDFFVPGTPMSVDSIPTMASE